MDKRQARLLLSIHRPGEKTDDPRVAEAEGMAAADPELASWWSEDQELDDVIATKLAAVPVPGDLRTRLVKTHSIQPPVSRWSWRNPPLFVAASIILVATFFGWWRESVKPRTSLADDSDEMVSFIRIDPQLALETTDFSRIKNFLQKSRSPSEAEWPPPLQRLPLLVDRTFRC